MKSFAVCTPSLLIIVLLFSGTEVTAQEGPHIIIHPGQDVELLCNVTIKCRHNETISWLINNMGPYGKSALHNGILAGYSSNRSNLLVQDIMMNDDRNNSHYVCVVVSLNDMFTIIDESDPTFIYVAGVPAMVPNVKVDDKITNINGDIVAHILSWGKSFNNLDPIVNYTVSCSGDVMCPPNFTTTDDTTRSYTITNLTPMTNYTFSVVATNSIGSGEAGVVMITTPGKVMTTTTTTASSVGMTTTTSSVGMTTTTTTSSVCMTITSSVGMITTTSSVGMTTTTSSVGMTVTTSSVGMTTTTTTTSSVSVTTTTSSADMTTTTTTSTTSTSSVGMTTTTSSVGMTTTTSSVGMTTTTTTTTSSVGMTTTSSMGMTTTTTSSAGMTTTTTSSVGMTTTTSSVDMTTTSSVGMTSTSDVIITATTASSDSMTTSTTTTSDNSNNNNIVVPIGVLVGVCCAVIMIIVISNVTIWICCFRKRHHKELHSPPANEEVTNPTYQMYAITDHPSKKPVVEPIACYAEVSIPPGVKRTPPNAVS